MWDRRPTFMKEQKALSANESHTYVAGIMTIVLFTARPHITCFQSSTLWLLAPFTLRTRINQVKAVTNLFALPANNEP